MKTATPDRTGIVLAALAALAFITLAAMVCGAAGNGPARCVPEAALFTGPAAPLCKSPPPTSGGTNVASDGSPATQRPALLVLPPIIRPDNTDSRFRGFPVCSTVRDVSLVERRQPCAILTSTSLVSSAVGRRVTLVGAKPSGTS